MAKSKNKNRFSFNLEWVNLLSELPPEERLAVYDAIVDYATKVTSEEYQMKPIDTKCYQLKPIGFLVFKVIKKEIDESQKSYKDKCLKLKAIGKLGGRKTRKKPKETNCNQMVFEEKERKQEKETFPPHPLSKEKEINKEKEPPPNPLKGAEVDAEESLEEKIEEYKNRKPIWKDSIRKKHKISSEEIDGFLEEFRLDMECRDTKVHKVAALFDTWLTDRLNHGTDNRTNPERGWGPGGRSPKLPPNDLGYGLVED